MEPGGLAGDVGQGADRPICAGLGYHGKNYGMYSKGSGGMEVTAESEAEELHNLISFENTNFCHHVSNCLGKGMV